MPIYPVNRKRVIEHTHQSSDNLHRYTYVWPIFVLLLLTLACNLPSSMPDFTRLFAMPTSTMTSVATLMPTFATPAIAKAVVLVLPRVVNPTNVRLLAPVQTLASTPSPTATPIPTLTSVESCNSVSCIPIPTPFPTRTLAPTPPVTPPTPFVEVNNGQLVDLRTGPGEVYNVVARLGPNIPIAVNGQNTEGTWYRLCCIEHETFWVQNSSLITVSNSANVPLYAPPLIVDLPPTPTPTPTPTSTPLPFERAAGPQLFASNNNMLTVWVKVYFNNAGKEQALPGYLLGAEFQAENSLTFEPRSNPNGVQLSVDQFSVGTAQIFYNYKFEVAPLEKGTWHIWLTDASGKPLTPVETFITDPGKLERELYIAWIRMR